MGIVQGFVFGGALIVAIGAQNAFVIRQGLMKRHLFLTATTCFFVDALLIVCGVCGFGYLIAKAPLLITGAKYFAVLFLVVYGALALKSALHPKVLRPLTSANQTLGLLLVLTLFNPHVYLDTVILLGSIASQQSDKVGFALGAILASFIWFYGLTYGARLFSPLFQKKMAWRVIDLLTACIMWGIALSTFINTSC